MRSDLAVIVVSTNEATGSPHAFRPSTSTRDGSRSTWSSSTTSRPTARVSSSSPRFRTRCSSRVRTAVLAQANNRGGRGDDSRYVLFLNPDTEILEGTLAGLIEALARPTSAQSASPGLAGRGVGSNDSTVFDGDPLVLRGDWLGEIPIQASWLGERELDMSVYERDFECDWISGSFVLVRREALQSAGLMDERFFISSRRDRPVSADQAGGVGSSSPSRSHDLAPRGQGGLEPEDGSAGRLRQDASHLEAFLARSPSRRDCRSRPWLRLARGCMAVGT